MAYRQSLMKYAEKYGVSHASRKYNKSRSYIYFWKQRWDGSVASLASQSRRPHSHPNQHTEAELKLIRDMRRRNPSLGMIELWHRLRKRGYIRCPESLFRVMRKMGLFPAEKPKNPYKPKPYEQMTYPEALRWLAKKYNIEIKERELTDEEKQVQNIRESLFVVNEFARDYFQNILYNHADGKAIAMSYFRQRGIRDDIVKKFQLGYSTTAPDALAQEAMRKGYKKEFLLKTGLCYEKEDGSLRDRFWGRVIFPWFNISGKVLGFGGRVLDSRTKGVNQKNYMAFIRLKLPL